MASWQSKTTLDYLNKANRYSPENYKSKYNVDELYNKYANYGDFKYDQNTDALYQDYKDRYTKLGNQAMKNTMAQATALTGGYGNSYATGAGQQAYGEYMSALADKGESLRQDAYSEWLQGKNDALSAWQTAANADAQDRANWNDNFNHWYGLYNDSNSNDYNQYQANMEMLNAQKSNNVPTYDDVKPKIYDEALEAYKNGNIDAFYDKYIDTYGQDNMDKVLSYVGAYGEKESNLNKPVLTGNTLTDVAKRWVAQYQSKGNSMANQLRTIILEKDRDGLDKLYSKNYLTDSEYKELKKMIK